MPQHRSYGSSSSEGGVGKLGYRPRALGENERSHEVVLANSVSTSLINTYRSYLYSPHLDYDTASYSTTSSLYLHQSIDFHQSTHMMKFTLIFVAIGMLGLVVAKDPHLPDPGAGRCNHCKDELKRCTDLRLLLVLH